MAWRLASVAVVVLLAFAFSSAEGATTKPGNCTILHKACSRCQSVSAYVGGSLVTRKVCRACNTQLGWALVGQGSNMTCSKLLKSVSRVFKGSALQCLLPAPMLNEQLQPLHTCCQASPGGAWTGESHQQSHSSVFLHRHLPHVHVTV
jgi:hypothetical protein